MTPNENVNKLSFTRLSFTFEDARLDGKIKDKVPSEGLITGFSNCMDARCSTLLPEHEDLQAQILLAQMVQESDG